MPNLAAYIDITRHSRLLPTGQRTPRLHVSRRAGPTLGSWQTAISVKGINMQSAQMSATGYGFQSTVPIPHTLDDLRIVHDNYDSSGSFSAKAMRPIWIAALLIAAGTGIAAYLGMFPEHDGAEISKANFAPGTAAPSAATTNSIAPPAAPFAAAKDSPAPETPNAVSKSEVLNAMPPPTTVRSQTVPPVKAKGNEAKSVSAPAKKVAPLAVTPANAVAPLPQEAAPPTPPAPIVEEKPVVPAPTPAPAPEVPQVDPPKL